MTSKTIRASYPCNRVGDRTHVVRFIEMHPMFTGIGEKQGNAVWIWEGASATVSDNTFDGYRAAVNATKATIIIKGNKISRFHGSAIKVKDSPEPVYVFGNTGVSTDPQAKIVDVQGSSGTIESNVLKSE